MQQPNRLIPPGVYRFEVNDEFSGLRLDQYLAEAGADFSRTLARRLIDIGGVHLSARRVRRCSEQVRAGDKIEVYVDALSLDPTPLSHERIIFRDQDLIVLDKPARMPTQPTPARYQGTVYAELQKLLAGTQRGGRRPSIGMVQRLDQDTSGVMVFSIHPRAHKKLTAQFLSHSIDKTYWALIDGVPDAAEGQFSSNLARRRSTNLMVSVTHGGKPAETRYKLLKTMLDVSLVEIKLVTGRSHQIRAHFSEAGLPLLGDPAYGGPRQVHGIAVPRQMLHARALAFSHPVTGQQMLFNSALPDDFANVLQSLEVA
jgi:23S rRNA pseudouridine1911/1915/1917 synthase